MPPTVSPTLHPPTLHQPTPHPAPTHPPALQLRDAQTRLESLTAERDRLVSALAEEQRAAAAARQQADSLNVQASEEVGG